MVSLPNALQKTLTKDGLLKLLNGFGSSKYRPKDMFYRPIINHNLSLVRDFLNSSDCTQTLVANYPDLFAAVIKDSQPCDFSTTTIAKLLNANSSDIQTWLATVGTHYLDWVTEQFCRSNIR